MAGLNKNVHNVNKIRITNIVEGHNYLSLSQFDIYSVFLSIGILVADVITDSILMIEYFHNCDNYCMFILLSLRIVLEVIIQTLSIKWHLLNNVTSKIHWITHCCLLGILHRYVTLLFYSFKVIKAKSMQNSAEICQQRYDVNKLHILYIFLTSAPSLVIHLFILTTLNSWITSSGVSLILSSFSIFWILLQYFRSFPITKEKSINSVQIKYWFQVAWNICMVTVRIVVFLLIVICFEFWIILLIGIHWFISTLWIFKRTKSGERTFAGVLYNCLIGVTQCFTFIDFDEELQLIEIFTYYIVVILENISALSLCFIFKNEVIPNNLMIILTSLAVTGTILGSGLIFLYHKYFYNFNCKIKFRKKVIDPESGQDVTPKSEFRSNVGGTSIKKKHFPDEIPNSELNLKEGISIDTDRKLLLENLVARSGTPTFICTPILDDSSSNDVLFHSVLNTTNENSEIFEDPNNIEDSSNLKNKLKRRGICSPSELGLQALDSVENDLFFEEIEPVTDLSVNKRRGICSSIQLEQYNDILSNPMNDIRISDDIQKKRRPIYVTFDSSDIEIITQNDVDNINNENCEIESKISDDSKYTLILSAPSEIMSAHDYENVCAVNIAREFWGLRSWRGYSDIETWLHDDSIVRDQDNITSTVGTSTSSEISSNDGFERGVSPTQRSDLDRLTSKNLSSLQDDTNDFKSLNTNIRRVKFLDQREDLFIAKPCIIDQNGSLLPLTTLSPIKEEIEENFEKNECGSSLVTTIDVIRKNTIGNSPRYIYNRTESPLSVKSLYKPKSLWSAQENVNSKRTPIYENHSISKNKLIANSKILLKLCDNELRNCDNLTNIMYLDKPIISTSLQSLVSSSSSEDILSIAEIARCFPLVKKPAGRPRRKFSLIRDRFEMTVRKQSNVITEHINPKLKSYPPNENKQNIVETLDLHKINA